MSECSRLTWVWVDPFSLLTGTALRGLSDVSESPPVAHTGKIRDVLKGIRVDANESTALPAFARSGGGCCGEEAVHKPVPVSLHLVEPSDKVPLHFPTPTTPCRSLHFSSSLAARSVIGLAVT